MCNSDAELSCCWQTIRSATEFLEDINRKQSRYNKQSAKNCMYACATCVQQADLKDCVCMYLCV